MPGGIVFSKPVALALGIVLAIAEVVNVNVHLSGHVHDAISLLVVVIASFGVLPAAGSVIRGLIPVHVAAALASLAGVLEVLQRGELHVGPTVHSILAFVLVLLAAIGIAPATVAAVKLAASKAAGARPPQV